jgi:predicted transcriptional regulator
MPEQPSRAGTVPITAHLPKDIRDRLKILAVRLNRTMNDLMAEALDDLFEKHQNDQTAIRD